MMASYFNAAVHMNNILFQGWDTNSTRDAIIAAVIALVATVFFEWTKTVKAYIIIRRRQSPLTYGKYYNNDYDGHQQQQEQQHQQLPYQRSVSDVGAGAGGPGSVSSTAQLLSSLKIPASIEQIRKWRITLFVLESCMHLFNFIFGYLLMLLVMTYSFWFLGAILIGSAVGFFLFDPVRQMYAEKYSDDGPSPVSERESTLARPAPHHANINNQQPQDWIMEPRYMLLEDT